MEFTRNRRIHQEIVGKSIAFDEKSIAVDTNSNENHRKSIRHHYEIAMVSVAFHKKSVAFDKIKNEITQDRQEISRKSLRNQ